MTYLDAKENFELFGIVEGDPIWTRENWNNYVDALQKDNQITEHQASTWDNIY